MKMVDGRQMPTDDGQTPAQWVYHKQLTISLHCEPNGSGKQIIYIMSIGHKHHLKRKLRPLSSLEAEQT